MQHKKTCGPFYLDALQSHAGGDESFTEAFAAGFVNGQAEKVYIGACRAAMFRPSEGNWSMVARLATEAAERYGLRFSTMCDVGEIWILQEHPGVLACFAGLAETEVNSPEWHEIRGWLCGVPTGEIDFEFHKRKGFGESCDEPQKSA